MEHIILNIWESSSNIWMDDADSSFTTNKLDQKTISQYSDSKERILQIPKMRSNLKIVIGRNQIWHKYLLILEKEMGI